MNEGNPILEGVGDTPRQAESALGQVVAVSPEILARELFSLQERLTGYAPYSGPQAMELVLRRAIDNANGTALGNGNLNLTEQGDNEQSGPSV